MIFTVANAVTALRLILIGYYVWLLGQHRLIGAAVVLALAWGLDAVDGYLARRLNQASVLGSLLDKVTDRLLLPGGALVAVVWGVISPEVLLIFAKDALLLLLIFKKDWRLAVFDTGRGGKIVTLLQGLALLWVLLGFPYQLPIILVVAGVGSAVAIRHLQKVW